MNLKARHHNGFIQCPMFAYSKYSNGDFHGQTLQEKALLRPA